MTPIQIDTAAVILSLTIALGYPPSLRELALELGLCMRGVDERILLLEKVGLARLGKPGTQRAVVVRTCRCEHPHAFLPIARSSGPRAKGRGVLIPDAALCLRCRGIVLPARLEAGAST